MDNDGIDRNMEHGAETIYGTHDDNNMVMSEKVNTRYFVHYDSYSGNTAQTM